MGAFIFSLPLKVGAVFFRQIMAIIERDVVRQTDKDTKKSTPFFPVRSDITDKEHWFVLSCYFSPISTDPAVVGPIALPLTDKVEHYMVTTKGEGRANCFDSCCRRKS